MCEIKRDIEATGQTLGVLELLYPPNGVVHNLYLTKIGVRGRVNLKNGFNKKGNPDKSGLDIGTIFIPKEANIPWKK